VPVRHRPAIERQRDARRIHYTRLGRRKAGHAVDALGARRGGIVAASLANGAPGLPRAVWIAAIRPSSFYFHYSILSGGCAHSSGLSRLFRLIEAQRDSADGIGGWAGRIRKKRGVVDACRKRMRDDYRLGVKSNQRTLNPGAGHWSFW